MQDRPLDCLVTAPGAGARIRQVHPVEARHLAETAARLGVADWVADHRFAARAGEVLLVPGSGAEDRQGAAQGAGQEGDGGRDGGGGVAAALLGLGDAGAGEAGGEVDPYLFAALPNQLPPGPWRILPPGGRAPAAASGAGLDGAWEEAAVLGFCLGAYRFEALRGRQGDGRVEASGRGAGVARPVLVAAGDGAGAAQARAVWLARDLINLPANHLGPADLAAAADGVCRRFGAACEQVRGESLAHEYPAVAAVGAGAARPAVVFRARWSGSRAAGDAPLVSLVGKGVCFDTGGLDLKPSAAMLRMKKDMGGAAIMLGLAQLVMELDLPLRLELRLGCVENSVSATSMRPSDVITTRKGLTVEIGNTDAEGRLVLCDLLHEACGSRPAMLLDAATLTGAARVALGPDLPALFSNDDSLADQLLQAGRASADPLWRLPLHRGYEGWLSSTVADLNNVSSKPMAGSVTAALFLLRFVDETVKWAHIDTYAWNDASRPGRPEGADAQGMRALFKGLLPLVKVDEVKNVSVT